MNYSTKAYALVFKTATILSLVMLLSCARETSTATNQAADRKSTPRSRRIVTWPYLRALARTPGNTSLTTFLKNHNQLAPKAPAGLSCNDPWFDACDPVDADLADLSCFRIDIPVRINDLTAYLSVAGLYKANTGDVVSVGAAVFGNTENTVWRNYALPVAAIEDDQLTVIVNMHYTSSVLHTNTFSVGAQGTATIGKATAGVNMTYKKLASAPMTQTGILFNETTVNIKSALGNGFMQLNGVTGPKHDYQIAQ